MEESCTHGVVKTAMQAGPIYYGERVHYFWSTSRNDTRRQYMEALQAVGTVVRAMLERLDAEFPPQSLEQSFCVFDVDAAHTAAQNPADWPTYEAFAESRVHRLLREGLGLQNQEEIRKTSRRFISAVVRLMPRRS